MPPTSHAPPPHQPRLVLYHQTHHHRNSPVSLLPLLTEAADLVPCTHLIIAAIHLNDPPAAITLNDDPPDAPKHDALWQEVALMQDVGVRVLGMLGGAAQGSFRRLDGSDAAFEAHYAPLRHLLRARNLDGLDLDVEEPMSLTGVVRLVDRLKADFGPGFLVTLAPVATALQGRPHLSGFDYGALEAARGASIAWYNTQFYNGWGALGSFVDYDAILRRGWRPDKVVVGALTSPRNGHGWLEAGQLGRTVRALGGFYAGFGGVMGWEYFNSEPGGEGRPWEWAVGMMDCVRGC